mgnify:CR=1 FL=1
MLWSRCTEERSVLSTVARAKQLVTRRHVTVSAPLGVTTGHEHGRQEEDTRGKSDRLRPERGCDEDEEGGERKASPGSAAIGLSILSQLVGLEMLQCTAAPTAGWTDCCSLQGLKEVARGFLGLK